MSLFYSKADLIICQSSEMLESLHRVSSQPLRRVSIIPNPAPNAQEFSQDFCSIPRKKVLLSVGRLSDEKGFDLGLRAFAEMKGHNEFHYQLIGEGPALEGLKCLAQELGVSERVEFLGFQANPNKFYCRSHGYILPSRYEGFPNVLLEAMGMGLPVLAFDCLSDLRQMIKDGFNGFLVPAEDYVSMGKKLAQLVEDSWNREEISEDVRSRFGLQAISNSYIKAFNQIL
jgi:glycosyltransferase involved in cell wall biosynthesis